MAKKIPNSFSIFSSKTLKEKQLEESFERKDGARNPFENNLNRSAGLNGNCTTTSSCESGKKCAWMHHQTDEQSSQKPKWKLRKAEWLKFSGNVECVWHLVKHASGRRAAEVFKETTEGHKVLRPIKRAKIHERHTQSRNQVHRHTQSRNQVHREGKLVLPSPVASMMYQNSRRTSREKTWVQSTQNLNENWDAISLVFLSAVLRENFSSFRSTLHNRSHIMLLNVWN